MTDYVVRRLAGASATVLDTLVLADRQVVVDQTNGTVRLGDGVTRGGLPLARQSPPGQMGPTGPMGPQGLSGPTGSKGDRGLVGATGPAGTPGELTPASPFVIRGNNGLNLAQRLLPCVNEWTRSGADDGPRFQAFFDYLNNAGSPHSSGVVLGQDYVFETPVSCWPTRPIQVSGQGRGKSGMYTQINDPTVAMWDFSRPGATSDNRNNMPYILKDIGFVQGWNLSNPSLLLRARYSSSHQFIRLAFVGYPGGPNGRGGSLVELSALFNARDHETLIFGGGLHIPFRNIPGTARFSIELGSKTLTCNEPIFIAGDEAGKELYISHGVGPGRHYFRIAQVNSSTSVTVTSQANVAITAKRGSYGGVTGNMAANSNVVQVDGFVFGGSIPMVGRTVVIPNAIVEPGGGGLGLYARITEVVDIRTFKIDKVAGKATGQVPIMFSPIYTIHDESDSGTNDARWDGLHFEEPRGTALAVIGGTRLNFNGNMKLHALNPQGAPEPALSAEVVGFNDQATLISAYITGGQVQNFGGDFEGGTHNPVGAIWFDGVQWPCQMGDVVGASTEGVPLIKSTRLPASVGMTLGSLSMTEPVSDYSHRRLIGTDGTGAGWNIGGMVGSYRSVPLGGRGPLTVSAEGLIVDAAPYQIVFPADNNIVATGTDAGTARPLTARVNRVTGGAAGTGVRLPSWPQWSGRSEGVTIINTRASTLPVYVDDGTYFEFGGVLPPYTAGRYVVAAAGVWTKVDFIPAAPVLLPINGIFSAGTDFATASPVAARVNRIVGGGPGTGIRLPSWLAWIGQPEGIVVVNSRPDPLPVYVDGGTFLEFGAAIPAFSTAHYVVTGDAVWTRSAQQVPADFMTWAARLPTSPTGLVVGDWWDNDGSPTRIKGL